MSSFSVRAIGILARAPDVCFMAEGQYCRFCLIEEDVTDADGYGGIMMAVQYVWFVATDLIGVAIAEFSRAGDQLFVEGTIQKNHWTGRELNEETTFVVSGFRFGARSGDGSGETGAGAPCRTPSSPPRTAQAMPSLAKGRV